MGGGGFLGEGLELGLKGWASPGRTGLRWGAEHRKGAWSQSLRVQVLLRPLLWAECFVTHPASIITPVCTVFAGGK